MSCNHNSDELMCTIIIIIIGVVQTMMMEYIHRIIYQYVSLSAETRQSWLAKVPRTETALPRCTATGRG